MGPLLHALEHQDPKNLCRQGRAETQRQAAANRKVVEDAEKAKRAQAAKTRKKKRDRRSKKKKNKRKRAISVSDSEEELPATSDPDSGSSGDEGGDGESKEDMYDKLLQRVHHELDERTFSCGTSHLQHL